MTKGLFVGALTAALLFVVPQSLLSAQQYRAEPQGQSLPEEHAKKPGQQSDAQAKIKTSVNLVVLPVTVKDRYGNLVPDLQRNDFRVFDDNTEQNLAVFTAEAFPLSLVVLIDDDLKSKEAEQMAPTLRAIAGGISADDEALICRYDLDFYPGKAFTGDFDTLLTELRNAQDASGPSQAAPVPFVTPPSDHKTGSGEPSPVPTVPGARPTKALDDAVFSATELLHDRGKARRKIILLISDGTNGPAFNHHTLDDNVEALLQENISVYCVAVGSPLAKHKFAHLIDYTTRTGGDIYYASKRDAIEKLYAQITEEARHEYTLAYMPVGNNRDTNYHKVSVRVARDGVTIKTREGYYAPAITPAGN
jgi:VWFA-related protein